ncbi:MAG: hypothetical protein A4E57_02798 [Syntrophorhabdaceae bacterium PtaU1.Bin034]|nr:MAG: hypothetical protein A4E57_02798 [Syntrophorhabdaceae bacterium PtaU1.Bin034]
MKQRLTRLFAVMAAVGFMMGLYAVPVAHTAVTLEVLNPRGEIPPSATFSPVTRVPDLAGKTIGIYWIGKAGGNNFWDAVEELLKQKYPTAKVKRYQGPFDLSQKTADTVAKECDVFFYGVGD